MDEVCWTGMGSHTVFIRLKPALFYFCLFFVFIFQNKVFHKISQLSTQYFCQSCGMILSVILEAVTQPVSKERCIKLVCACQHEP